MDGKSAVKITPVAPARAMGDPQQRSIFNIGGWKLQKLPFVVGERVRCRGFQGKLYPGIVIECKWTNGGYAKFILVRVKLDNLNQEIRVNWSLFPDRVQETKEK